MMSPLPSARRKGSAAWVTQSAPMTLVSSWERASFFGDLLEEPEVAEPA